MFFAIKSNNNTNQMLSSSSSTGYSGLAVASSSFGLAESNTCSS